MTKPRIGRCGVFCVLERGVICRQLVAAERRLGRISSAVCLCLVRVQASTGNAAAIKDAAARRPMLPMQNDLVYLGAFIACPPY